MSKDNVEKYDGEKNMDQDAVVAVLPPDDWARDEKDLNFETGDEAQVKENLHLTSADLAFAEEYAKDLSLEDIRRILTNALKIHEHDPNYPVSAIEQAKEFLHNPEIMENPEMHAKLIHDVKIEAALMDGHSPYETVRSVVSNTDDPTLTVMT